MYLRWCLRVKPGHRFHFALSHSSAQPITWVFSGRARAFHFRGFHLTSSHIVSLRGLLLGVRASGDGRGLCGVGGCSAQLAKPHLSTTNAGHVPPEKVAALQINSHGAPQNKAPMFSGTCGMRPPFQLHHNLQ